MKYLLLIAAVATLALTACSEPRRTPDGHIMDNPVPSAYSAEDFEGIEE